MLALLSGIQAGNGEVLISFADVIPNAVPEPASLGLLGAGVLGLCGFRRRRHGQ